MPLPAGVELVTVSSGQPLTLPDGTWIQGTLAFTGPDLVTIGGQDVVLGGGVKVQLADGQFSVPLVATDATGMSPTGWTYKVVASFTNAPGWTRYLTLPKAAPSVTLADVLVPDPVAGTFTVLVDGSTVLNGVTVSGTASSGKVLTATSASAATWQTPSGGGGGSSIRTASVRVTDDNLGGLPSASSWTIAQTSAGTKLQCSIPAAAGDRIRLAGNFMYVGAHFLDWTLLDSGGAIALYAASGTSSPLAEGNPAMYPSLSFSKMTASDMFTVASGHIDGSGRVTVALAHQGTTSGTVYAHTTYPWRLRVENIGPEPA